MDLSEEQFGFDLPFISEVPEYLKCVVCHFVLRRPILIMKCVHRVCETCFERVKGQSEHMNTELCCPIDKEVIDLNKVIRDTGVCKVIGDLQVICSNKELGCMWTGDLRYHEAHKGECEYKERLHQQSIFKPEKCDSAILKDLCERVSQCEVSMVEKEKDLASLKYNLHELQKSFDEKEVEVDSLKTKNIETEKEMNLLKEQSKELQLHFDKERDELTHKNQLLHNRVFSFENHLMELKKLFVEEIVEGTANKNKVDEPKKNMTDETNVQPKKSPEINFQVNGELKKLTEEIQKANNEMKTARINIDKSISKRYSEINKIAAWVTATEKSLEDKFDTLNHKISKESKNITLIKDWKKGIDRAIKNIGNLEYHVANIENIIFCNPSDSSKDIVLQWNLQNYQYHFDLGEAVFSPIFYTQVNCYCFKLLIEWTGENKENMGLFLKLCRGSNYNKTVEPFNMSYSLEMVDKTGKKLSRMVSLPEIERNRKTFTLPLGKNECNNGRGFSIFITTSDVKDYVVNDMLSISCTLKPC